MELFDARGGPLVAQAAWQELPHPSIAGTSSPSASSHACTRLLTVIAPTHRTSVTRMMCSLSRVVSAGVSRLLLPRVSAHGALRFRAQTLDLAQAPLHASIALLSCTGPACRGTSRGRWGRRGCCGASKRWRWARLQRVQRRLGRLRWHGGFDVGQLLVCERPVDGFSWSPPGRALQADALRELVVVQRGSCQIERRRRAIADKVVHRVAVGKHLGTLSDREMAPKINFTGIPDSDIIFLETNLSRDTFPSRFLRLDVEPKAVLYSLSARAAQKKR